VSDDLNWRPVSEYDRAQKPWVLAAAGDSQALAYFGELPDVEYFEELGFAAGVMWRHAADSVLHSPLDFEPDRFAEIDEDWQARLAED